jgi:hypothetical protein
VDKKLPRVHKRCSMSVLADRDKMGREMATRQTELPLRIVVCAWCQPGAQGTDLGAVSHGICPRHLRKMTKALQTVSAGSRVESDVRGARHPRRLKKCRDDVAQLRFESLASLSAHASPFNA